jgi:hypothetical protein
MNKTIYSKDEIIDGLETAVKTLVDWTTLLSDEEFISSVRGKWAPGEQLEHLRKSSKPLVMALKLPKFVIKLKVGKPNRASRTFEAVKEKYEKQLATQEIGTTAFFPDAELKKSRQEITDAYLLVSKKLIRALRNWREEELDKYILPHPLLGKLTVREMLFFTIHHTQHHHQHLKELLN